MRIASILFTLLILLMSSCKNQPQIVQEEFKYEELNNSSKEVHEVLYSMYLPTDMSNIFSLSGTNYIPDLPASIEHIALYTNTEQMAVMLGVYGVDITYMKLLGQTLPAAQYYEVIESLSENINIPGTLFLESSEQMEQHFSNEDSLAAVIEDIYVNTDQFFRKNGDEHLAALSLLGGWVEAMYIGVSIFESDSGNNVIAKRILQQKFSLNSIYVILSNYQESLLIKEYLLMLKKLRKVFENVEIRYQKEGFSVDTTQKKFHAYNTNIRYNEETMNDLKRIIPQIRNEILAPRN